MSSCGCGSKFRQKEYSVVCACSGAADTGWISDRAARTLSLERVARMSCTAAIAAGDEDVMQFTVDGQKLLAIDGCDKDCTKKILKARGFVDFLHIRVTDLGMEKGKTPVTDEAVQKVVSLAKSLLSYATSQK